MIFILTVIKVEKSINIYNDSFRSCIATGIKKAFNKAFTKANFIFNQKSNQMQNPVNISVSINDITLTGRTNSENTKNIVQVKYSVIDLDNGQTFPAVYAADTINLLTAPEMGIYLNHEVDNQGFAENNPRVYSSNTDQKLWIIGAVLGPLAFLIILFWLIAFVYYKCIRPRSNKGKIMEKEKLKQDSPSSVNI